MDFWETRTDSSQVYGPENKSWSETSAIVSLVVIQKLYYPATRLVLQVSSYCELT